MSLSLSLCETAFKCFPRPFLWSFRVLIFIAESGGLVAFKLCPFLKEIPTPFSLSHHQQHHHHLVLYSISIDCSRARSGQPSFPIFIFCLLIWRHCLRPWTEIAWVSVRWPPCKKKQVTTGALKWSRFFLRCWETYRVAAPIRNNNKSSTFFLSHRLKSHNAARRSSLGNESTNLHRPEGARRCISLSPLVCNKQNNKIHSSHGGFILLRSSSRFWMPRLRWSRLTQRRPSPSQFAFVWGAPRPLFFLFWLCPVGAETSHEENCHRMDAWGRYSIPYIYIYINVTMSCCVFLSKVALRSIWLAFYLIAFLFTIATRLKL